jgi:hypothetical protein
MSYQVIQTICCVSALAVALTVSAQAASPESKHSKQDGASPRAGLASTMPAPKDCAQIKAGTADSTAESAAQKDCETRCRDRDESGHWFREDVVW